jgi:cell division protein FtsL
MATENPKLLSDKVSWNSLIGGLVLLALLIVFVAWLGVAVQNSLESLEEKVDNQSVVVLSGEGAAGIEIVEGQTRMALT